MKKLFLGVASALFLALTAQAGSSLELPKYGFQIDPLDTPPKGPQTLALASFLPSKGNFSANVTVMIQTYDKTMADYIKLSLDQFKQMDWTVLAEKKVSESEWTVEYSGRQGAASLHWYGRAFLKSGKVYLVTATGLDKEWQNDSVALKKCVDSFKLK